VPLGPDQSAGEEQSVRGEKKGDKGAVACPAISNASNRDRIELEKTAL